MPAIGFQVGFQRISRISQMCQRRASAAPRWSAGLSWNACHSICQAGGKAIQGKRHDILAFASQWTLQSLRALTLASFRIAQPTYQLLKSNVSQGVGGLRAPTPTVPPAGGVYGGLLHRAPAGGGISGVMGMHRPLRVPARHRRNVHGHQIAVVPTRAQPGNAVCQTSLAY